MRKVRDALRPVPPDDRATSWEHYDEIESQLRVIRPAVLRKDVPAEMVREYRDLAPIYGYSFAVDFTAYHAGAVRLFFTRDDRTMPSGTTALRGTAS